MKTRLFKLLGPAVALVLCGVLCFNTVACTSADIQKSVTLVVQYLPAVLQLAQAGASIAAAFAPADQGQINSTMSVITNGANQLQTLCTSYLNKPDQGVWKQIIATVDDIVTAGDQQLLDAARIMNPDARQKATIVLASLDAALHVLDAYISQAQPASQVKAQMQARKAKLQAVVNRWSEQDKQNFRASTGISVEDALRVAGN